MHSWTQQFDAYPQWVVITSLTATAFVVLWILAKVFKWVFKFTLALGVIVLIGGAILWMFLRAG